jgi:tRNA pseudouridine38-40 synthase
MRLALCIEYDGTGFSGWQRLAQATAIQSVVESALGFVADHPVEVVCAGRTDAGVHALCQVVHFDTQAQRSERGWVLGTNSRLPPSVALRWAKPVDDDFHARYGALARRYRYVIVNRQMRPALRARYVAWERAPLDAAAMHRAAQALIGERDFSAFRTIACQSRTPMRNVHALAVTRDGDDVVIDIQANAFLHHMVRNIVGSLMPVGRGEQPESWIAQLLAGRDRAAAGPTAPAQGLTFLGPLYPARFALPAEVALRE